MKFALYCFYLYMMMAIKKYEKLFLDIILMKQIKTLWKQFFKIYVNLFRLGIFDNNYFKIIKIVRLY